MRNYEHEVPPRKVFSEFSISSIIDFSKYQMNETRYIEWKRPNLINVNTALSCSEAEPLIHWAPFPLQSVPSKILQMTIPALAMEFLER